MVSRLRQIEGLTATNIAFPLAYKEAGINDVTYYRWRKEYGGLKADQTKKLKNLERENARLKRVVANPQAWRAAPRPRNRGPEL